MDELLKQTLLPLLGGFLFVIFNWRARFVALRSSGEKLFLICAVVGVVLAVLSRLLVFSFVWSVRSYWGDGIVHDVRSAWAAAAFFPPTHFLAFCLGPVLALLLNQLPKWRRDAALDWAIERVSDRLEQMLENSRKGKKLLLLTLRSGRVYVGVVKSLASTLMGLRHVVIIPFLSGYRRPLDSTTHAGRVEFSTYYSELVEILLQLDIQDIEEGDEVRVLADDGERQCEVNVLDMGVLFGKDDIETVSYFDVSVYAFLNRDRDPEAWQSVSQLCASSAEFEANNSPALTP